ncbi:MAG: DUF2029 domain-containing protein [Acidobacteria bacterium]|nr:DUF2029 domain-containing protein [Acidobacteriota bacterium]
MARLVGPGWEQREIRFVCLAVIAAGIVALLLSLPAAAGRPVFGIRVMADFPAFYLAGDILNRYTADRLYDLELQDRLYRELRPGAPPGSTLPFAYPPYFALLFRPFARLPYLAAYLVWIFFSLCLYLLGLNLIWPRSELPQETWITGVLLALSFQPFLIECWIGGQTTGFGFCVLALSLWLVQRDRLVLAGMVISLCLYKPTLLVLVLPCLLIGRQFPVLGGFSLGALMLAAVSVGAVGMEACRGYVQLLFKYFSGTTGSASPFRTWKFVDLNAFFQLLPGGRSMPGRVLFVLVAAACFGAVVVAWRRYPKSGRHQQLHLWAAGLTGTLVVNVYVPIYDCSIAVLGACLTARLLPAGHPRLAQFNALVAATYLSAWVTQAIAAVSGIQMFTVLLLAVTALQLRLAREEQDPGRALSASPSSASG